MNEIDKLEVRELAEAVALAQDWAYVSTTPGGHGYWEDVEGRYQFDGEVYRPYLDSDQALHLDGKGWEWELNQSPRRLAITITGGAATWTVFTSVWLSDFPTKAAAYATARCRAFLKAKAAR